MNAKVSVSVRVVLGQSHRLVHPLEQSPRHTPIATTGEADAHALLVELVSAAQQDVLVEAHQVAHFVDRSPPVLGRERVHGEPVDAELERALDRVEQRLFAGGVAFGALQATCGGPAAVAVHHAADVGGDAGLVESVEQAITRTLPLQRPAVGIRV